MLYQIFLIATFILLRLCRTVADKGYSKMEVSHRRESRQMMEWPRAGGANFCLAKFAISTWEGARVLLALSLSTVLRALKLSAHMISAESFPSCRLQPKQVRPRRPRGLQLVAPKVPQSRPCCSAPLPSDTHITVALIAYKGIVSSKVILTQWTIIIPLVALALSHHQLDSQVESATTKAPLIRFLEIQHRDQLLQPSKNVLPYVAELYRTLLLFHSLGVLSYVVFLY